MRRYVILYSLVFIFLTACSKKEENVKLEKGSPVYLFAQNIAKVFPFLNPDSNNVLVKTTHFTLSTGTVFNRVNANFGNDISQLSSLDSERFKIILNQTAESLAQQKVLLLKADEAGIKVSNASVDSVLEQQYSRSGGEEEYLSFIQANGITLDYVKNEIKINLSTQRYVNRKIGDKLSVPEDEIVKEYKKEIKATVRHILISTDGKTEEEKVKAKKDIEKILKRVRRGEDFVRLAKQFSEDPGTKNNGGLLEDFNRGQTVPEFDKVSFSLPIGEISGPIETQFGYHIIKIIGRKSEERPLKDVRAKIESKLTEQKRKIAFEKLWQELSKDVDYQMVEY